MCFAIKKRQSNGKTEKLNAGRWLCITGSSLESLKTFNTATPQI